MNDLDCNSVAIIGISGRFPGAENLEELWENLRDGRNTTTFYSEEELVSEGISQKTINDPNYVRAAAVIKDAKLFDALYFNFSPREAEYIDPQHRVFLECAQQALEDAGCDPLTYAGSIGIYAGSALSVYELMLAFSNARILQESDSLRTLFATGVANDYLATRASYKLRLRGPGITVQTACSTSLVAVHLACQSLLAGESDIALAGGVSIQSSYSKTGYYYTEGGMVSPDGHCRPFDAAAQGTIFGDGAAVVVLKRLDRALADGDCVRAVIRGTAVNNDGSDKIGFTAPSVSGQVAVIAEAMAVSGTTPDTIGYIEAHGTATVLGDPIEIAALSQVFATGGVHAQACLLGSLKGNIGHLNHASGISGLIKIVLALENELIPGTANFREPNARLKLEETPFRITASAVPWPRGAIPRRAGINNFGIGGTNAHAIIEEAPLLIRHGSSREWHLLPVSGKSANAASATLARLGKHLVNHPELHVPDAAYTLAAGRATHAHARLVLCRDAADAARSIAENDPRYLISGQRQASCKVALMFPGQGSQRIGMGRHLYAVEPAFRSAFDRCCTLIQPHLGLDLRSLLHGGETPEATALLLETRTTQPALFAVCYALVQLWIDRGVSPACLIGHSIGELVAATVAGVFTLEDASRLVVARGTLMGAQPPGLMSVVPVGAEQIVDLLPTTVEIAAFNSDTTCVIAGPRLAVEAFESELRLDGIFCSRLRTSHAFHSAMMTPATDAFAEIVSRVERRAPQVPFVSNVTGTWITDEDAVDPAYWARQLRSPVRFADGLRSVAEKGVHLIIEVGPGQTTAILARQVLAGHGAATLVSMLPQADGGSGEAESFCRSVAQAWVAGAPVDLLAAYGGEARRKISLPPYAFQRDRYWAVTEGHQDDALHETGPVEIDNATFAPNWKIAPLPPRSPSRGTYLVFTNGDALSDELMKKLRNDGARVLSVSTGTAFKSVGTEKYTISPGEKDDYDKLFTALTGAEIWPEHIVYMWSASNAVRRRSAEAINLAYYGLVFLFQVTFQYGKPTDVAAICSGAYNVVGTDTIYPFSALAVGPIIVAPLEQEALSARLIDLPSRITAPAQLAERLAAALAEPATAPVLAYRGRHFWTSEFSPILLNQPDETSPEIASGSVILITGGLGDLGLQVAEEAVRLWRAKLVLVGRRGLPPRAVWDTICAADPTGRDARVIGKIRTMEADGAEILVAKADAGDLGDMRVAIAAAEAQFGRINVVFHMAGIAGSGPMVLKDPTAMQAVLNPKVNGTLNIEKLFQRKSLDLLVLFSSIAALMGGVGLADYTAANAFLDAMAARPARPAAKRTVSVNWDAWQEIGMAVMNDLPGAMAESWREELKVIGIFPREGVDVLRAILASDYSQVLVSKRTLAPRAAGARAGLLHLRKASASVSEQAAEPTTETRYARPHLSSDFIAPRNEMEKILSEIWSGILNIDCIGVHDDFIELGGHSLLSLQMLSKMKAQFKLDLRTQDFFGKIEAMTISEFVRIINEKMTEEAKIEEAVV